MSNKMWNSITVNNGMSGIIYHHKKFHKFKLSIKFSKKSSSLRSGGALFFKRNNYSFVYKDSSPLSFVRIR